MTPQTVTKVNGQSTLESIDFLWLELTAKCNLQCVHCYADSSPYLPMYQEMQLEDWRSTLYEARSLGCSKVQFISGEPTIYPHLIDLIEYASDIGYDFIEVFTNGTNFTNDIKESFLKSKVALAFSVYSLHGDIHDAVTLRHGSFAKTIENIRWALKVGLTVRAAIIDVEINHKTIQETEHFLKNLGVIDVGVDGTRGIGRGATNAHKNDQMDELCGKCWQGKLCVTASGEIFPYVFSRFYSVGNMTEGLAKIVRGDRLMIGFRSTLKAKIENLTGNSCNPQCGPDCSPAECSPQEDCDPLSGCKPTDALIHQLVSEQGIGCSPSGSPCPPARPCRPTEGCKPIR